MPNPADDPRLTAFALGELTGAEREAVEKMLEENPEARRAVEAARATGERLAAAFAAEPGPGLTAAQKAAIAGRIEARRPSGVVSILRIVAVAAGLVLMVGTGVFAVLGGFTREDRGEANPGVVARRRVVEASRGGGGITTSSESSYAIGPHRNFFSRPNRGRRAAGSWGARFNAAEIAKAQIATTRDLSASRKGLSVGAFRPFAATPYDGPGSSVPPNMQPPGAPAPSPTPAPRGLVTAAGTLEDKIVVDGERRVRATRGQPAPSTEAYDAIVENAFQDPRVDPLSTFSIDVDTGSYANTRRFLRQNQLPPPGAVRIEEFVNYFAYDYAPPIDEHPFGVHVEVAGCPWARPHRLVRIGLKGRVVPRAARPASNLVFLLDVSGSMAPPNKLPLVRRAMKELVQQLDGRDRVAIVVYAGASGLVLPSTPAGDPEAILTALDRLGAGGSTNGGAGIRLAYRTAAEHFIGGGVNRVILCTDGDFNVGITNRSELVRLIEAQARSGVFLTVLGFGMGNYKDATLEQLADKGNGHYAYIDNEREARKVLVDGFAGTLITIAKDVKIQVEFNPARVAGFRLLGYENRRLAHRDFNDDTRDAGEIGAGHTVTALYEVVPAGGKVPGPSVDPLKYQARAKRTAAGAFGAELLTVKLRYKQPAAGKSTRMEVPVVDHGASWTQASRDFKFAAAVAAFALVLRDSRFKGTATFDQVLELAEEGKGADPHGHRAEFLELVRKAKALKR